MARGFGWRGASLPPALNTSITYNAKRPAEADFVMLQAPQVEPASTDDIWNARGTRGPVERSFADVDI